MADEPVDQVALQDVGGERPTSDGSGVPPRILIAAASAPDMDPADDGAGVFPATAADMDPADGPSARHVSLPEESASDSESDAGVSPSAANKRHTLAAPTSHSRKRGWTVFTDREDLDNKQLVVEQKRETIGRSTVHPQFHFDEEACESLAVSALSLVETSVMGILAAVDGIRPPDFWNRLALELDAEAERVKKQEDARPRHVKLRRIKTSVSAISVFAMSTEHTGLNDVRYIQPIRWYMHHTSVRWKTIRMLIYLLTIAAGIVEYRDGVHDPWGWSFPSVFVLAMRLVGIFAMVLDGVYGRLAFRGFLKFLAHSWPKITVLTSVLVTLDHLRAFVAMALGYSPDWAAVAGLELGVLTCAWIVHRYIVSEFARKRQKDVNALRDAIELAEGKIHPLRVQFLDPALRLRAQITPEVPAVSVMNYTFESMGWFAFFGLGLPPYNVAMSHAAKASVPKWVSAFNLLEEDQKRWAPFNDEHALRVGLRTHHQFPPSLLTRGKRSKALLTKILAWILRRRQQQQQPLGALGNDGDAPPPPQSASQWSVLSEMIARDYHPTMPERRRGWAGIVDEFRFHVSWTQLGPHLRDFIFMKWWRFLLLYAVLVTLCVLIPFATDPSRLLHGIGVCARGLVLLSVWQRGRYLFRSLRRAYGDVIRMAILLFVRRVVAGGVAVSGTMGGGGRDVAGLETLGAATLTLFVLLSGENYESVITSRVASTKQTDLSQRWWFAYFGSFIFVGTFLIWAILMGQIFVSYRSERAKNNVRMWLREDYTLETAHRMMQYVSLENSNSDNSEHRKQFSVSRRMEYPPEATGEAETLIRADVLFEIFRRKCRRRRLWASPDTAEQANKRLEILLAATEVSWQKKEQDAADKKDKKDENKEETEAEMYAKWAKQCITKRQFDKIVDVWRLDVRELKQPRPSRKSIRAHRICDWLFTIMAIVALIVAFFDVPSPVTAAFCEVLAALLLADILLVVGCLATGRILATMTVRIKLALDVILLATGVVQILATRALVFGPRAANGPHFFISVALLRVLYTRRLFARFVSLVPQMIPPILQACGIIVLFIFWFVVAAMELFSPIRAPHFLTSFDAMVTLFQLTGFVGEGWDAVMMATAEAGAGPACVWFFVGYFFWTTILADVGVSIVIAVFEFMHTKQRHQLHLFDRNLHNVLDKDERRAKLSAKMPHRREMHAELTMNNWQRFHMLQDTADATVDEIEDVLFHEVDRRGHTQPQVLDEVQEQQQQPNQVAAAAAGAAPPPHLRRHDSQL